MKAVIMAGGEGQRLRPLTCTIPKPMVPILGRPVMEYGIELLKEHGITKIASTLQYLPEVIRDYFQDGRRFGVELHHFLEETPLGTAGSVKNAEAFLDETFVVLSGDAITDINLSEAVAFHQEKGAAVTLVLKKVPIPLEYGVVITDEEGRIERFLEKPGWGEVFSDLVNTGIYILEPRVFEYIQKNKKTDFSKDVFPHMLHDELPLYGFVSEGYWCDIGSIEQYAACQRDILDGICRVRIDAVNYHGIYAQPGAEFSAENIEPPCFLGRGSVVETGAKIGKYTVLGENSRICRGADVKRSILWRDSVAGEGAVLRGAILCKGAEADLNAQVHEGGVIGEESAIGENTKVLQNVGIWPHKVIECGCDIKENIIWGEVKRHFNISASALSGRLGTELTPEFASRAASAFAKAIEAPLAIAHDGDNGSAMLYEAVCAGALAQGENVNCFEKATLMALRFAARTLEVGGGVFIGRQDDKYRVWFVDENGLALTRKLEKGLQDAFERRTYRAQHKTGKIISRQSLMPYYENMAAMLLGKAARSVRIAIGAHDRAEKHVLQNVLQMIGCDAVLCSGDEGIPLCIREEKAEFGVWIDGPSQTVLLFDAAGNRLEGTAYQTLACFLLCQIPDIEDVAIPVGMPDQLYDYILHNGKKASVTKTVDDESVRLLFEKNTLEENHRALAYGVYTDAVYLAGFLAKLVSEGAFRIEDISGMLTDSRFQSREVPCKNSEIGKIMRSLYHREGADHTMPEGVKVGYESGWAAVLPAKERSSLKIVTQGLSEEYAKELCDEYISVVEHAKDMD